MTQVSDSDSPSTGRHHWRNRRGRRVSQNEGRRREYEFLLALLVLWYLADAVTPLERDREGYQELQKRPRRAA